ncbi:hypothetical protein CDD83_7812 [Cordyceps sp. RAO-2017]|nr:hypothetical protein CDD83_7812 [Cordyceps sp. RAO-2017]
MLRQGIRRCAGLAGGAASTSMLLRSRVALPKAAALSRCNSPQVLKSFTFLSRPYSSEALAEESPSSGAADKEPSAKFADLANMGVHPNLLKAIVNDMQYTTMTPVQAKTISPALKGTDIVAQAKTGTGKTIAFLLPLLQRMITEDPSLASRSASYTAKSNDIRGIIMSPTRELAEQIATEARRLTKHTGLVIQSAVGGTHKLGMLRQTQREGCHLMVATPGRLHDLLSDPSTGIDAPNLAAMVLDEADRMLDVGFERELNQIVSHLPNPSEKVRQTMLVSATIPDNVIRLARTMIRPDDFEFVQTISENESLTHEKVPQHVVPLKSWSNVFPAIFELIDREVAATPRERNTPGFKAIVYFNTTALVELSGEMGFQRRRSQAMQTSTFSIHSKLTQYQRTKVAQLFKDCRSGVLFSSDVTARGMDFPNVTHVIQVDTPRDRESYIHRLGRTARQNKEGQGWLFLPPTSTDATRHMLRGLPLKENSDLATAKFDVSAGEDSKYHAEVKTLMSRTQGYFGYAYKSIFGLQGGSAMKMRDLIGDLNLWATEGCGLPEPPAVSESWARKQGLSGLGLNVKDGVHEDDRRDNRNGGQRFGGGGRGGSGYGDRRSSRSSDPFERMGRDARRDDPRGGRDGGRGGGRSGGYGRGRSSW